MQKLKSGSGRIVTWRDRKAVRYIAEGNYEGALSVLRDPEREREVESAQKMNECSTDIILGYISENRRIIQVLRLEGLNTEKVKEITLLYEKCAELTEKYRLETDILEEYVDFLVYQNRYRQAFDTALRIKRLVEYVLLTNCDRNEQVKKLCRITAKMADMSCKFNDFNKAEELFDEAVRKSENLLLHNPDKYWQFYIDKVALSYADFLVQTKKYGALKNLIMKVIKYANEYETSDETMGNLFMYMNISLDAAEEKSMAEECLEMSLSAFENLCKANEEKYLPMLAEKYIKAADFYIRNYRGFIQNLVEKEANHNRVKKGLEYCKKAIDIYEQLAEKNPEAWLAELGKACEITAEYESEVGETDQVCCVYYENAISIYRQLSENEPVMYLNCLASAYVEFADYLRFETDWKWDDVSIILPLNEEDNENPTPEQKYLLDSDDEERDVHRLRKASSMLRKAVNIYKDYACAFPDVYGGEYCRACELLADLLRYIGYSWDIEELIVEACGFYRHSLQSMKALFGIELNTAKEKITEMSEEENLEKSEEENLENLYKDMLMAENFANYINCAVDLTNCNYISEAISLYEDIIAWCNCFKWSAWKKMEYLISRSYKNLASLYKETNNVGKAEKLIEEFYNKSEED